jgi:hypothetical protein
MRVNNSPAFFLLPQLFPFSALELRKKIAFAAMKIPFRIRITISFYRTGVVWVDG